MNIEESLNAVLNRTGTLNRVRKFAEVAPIKAALITGIAAIALAGCATTTEAPTSSSEQPTPEATETAPERYEGSDFERTDPLPASLKAADEASPEEFNALPKDEQIKWATWAGQYKDEFAAYYASVSGEEMDKPYALTLDSDVISLMNDRDYQQRIAASFGDGSTPHDKMHNGLFDVDEAKKYFSAFTIDTDGSAAERTDKFIQGILDTEGGQAINVVKIAAAGYYNSAKVAQKSGYFTVKESRIQVGDQAIPAEYVQWTDVDGRDGEYTIAAYQTENYKGEKVVVAVVEKYR